MTRNYYTPPDAPLELPASDQSWGRVRLLFPSLGAACVVIVGLFLAGLMNSRQWSGVLSGILASFFVAYWFAAALAFSVGLLFRHLAERQDLGRAWTALMTGAAVGEVSVLALDFTMRRIPALSSIHVPPIAHIQFGVVGAVAGFVFWLIAKRQLRPDTSLERARVR